MRCPTCDTEMEQQEDDAETNVQGGWFCEPCNVFVHDSEVDNSDDLR